MQRDLQQAMLNMNSSKEGYMLWLDFSKPELQSKSLEQYLSVRPNLLPRIPAKYRTKNTDTAGASNIGTESKLEQLIGLQSSKQQKRAATLDAAAADIRDARR